MLENLHGQSNRYFQSVSCVVIGCGGGRQLKKKGVEAYIRDHSEAEFSHGICPDCARKLYPGLVGDKDEHA